MTRFAVFMGDGGRARWLGRSSAASAAVVPPGASPGGFLAGRPLRGDDSRGAVRTAAFGGAVAPAATAAPLADAFFDARTAATGSAGDAAVRSGGTTAEAAPVVALAAPRPRTAFPAASAVPFAVAAAPAAAALPAALAAPVAVSYTHLTLPTICSV